jgi:hypothetical protein
VADALRKESGLDVQSVDGARGEFTVTVDGQEVARKEGDKLPPVEQVVGAVKNTGQATAGARH